MKLFDAIGDFLRTLFVPSEAPKKPPKPGAQTHGGFRDGFEKLGGRPVNLTGVAPAAIVVPEETAAPAPQPDNDFVASLDDLPFESPVAPAEAPQLAETSTEALLKMDLSMPVDAEAALPAPAPSAADAPSASVGSLSLGSITSAPPESALVAVVPIAASSAVDAPHELAAVEAPLNGDSQTDAALNRSGPSADREHTLEADAPGDRSPGELAKRDHP